MPRNPASAPLSGALVWSRALVTAFVAFSVGTIAHWSAGGLTPGPVGLALLASSLVLPAAALLHRRASGVRLASMVAIGQLWTHFWLTAAAGHRGDVATAQPRLPAHERSDLVALPVSSGPRRGSLLDLHQQMVDRQITASDAMPDPVSDAIGHLLADLTGPHAVMMAAHVIAGALIGCWLARGENALFTLLALAVARIGAHLVHRLLDATTRIREVGVLLRRRPALITRARDLPSPGRVLLGPAPRRGPPAAVLA